MAGWPCMYVNWVSDVPEGRWLWRLVGCVESSHFFFCSRSLVFHLVIVSSEAKRMVKFSMPGSPFQKI